MVAHRVSTEERPCGQMRILLGEERRARTYVHRALVGSAVVLQRDPLDWTGDRISWHSWTGSFVSVRKLAHRGRAGLHRQCRYRGMLPLGLAFDS